MQYQGSINVCKTFFYTIIHINSVKTYTHLVHLLKVSVTVTFLSYYYSNRSVHVLFVTFILRIKRETLNTGVTNSYIYNCSFDNCFNNSELIGQRSQLVVRTDCNPVDLIILKNHVFHILTTLQPSLFFNKFCNKCAFPHKKKSTQFFLHLKCLHCQKIY